MTGEYKKARIVDLSDDLAVDALGPWPEGGVVKIVRTHVLQDSYFDVYTKDDGLILRFAFDSEIGEVLGTLVGGGDDTTYHRTLQGDGGLCFEGAPLEGLSW